MAARPRRIQEIEAAGDYNETGFGAKSEGKGERHRGQVHRGRRRNKELEWWKGSRWTPDRELSDYKGEINLMCFEAETVPMEFLANIGERMYA